MIRMIVQRTCWLICITSVTTSQAIDTDSLPYLDARAQEAMVLVRTPTGEGSGFIVGYDAAMQTATILSAQHVIAGEGGDVSALFFDGRESPARVIHQSASKDICVLTARRKRPPTVLELDLGIEPLEPLQPIVVVGRDDQGVKQHVGAYLEDAKLADVDSETRCLSSSALSLPGFSGGPMTARTVGGRVAVFGMLTRGSPEISTGPDAAELTAFLAEAGVHVGSAPTADVVADDASVDDLLNDPAEWNPDDGELAEIGGETGLTDVDAYEDPFDDLVDAEDLIDEAFAAAGWPLAPRRPPTGDPQQPPGRVRDRPRGARVHREVIVVPSSGVRIVVESVIE